MGSCNADQQSFWSDEAGPIWAAQMQAMDAALDPVLQAVLDDAAVRPGEDVLDIGCGAGTSTFAAADLVGADGSACGADISATLLKAAEARKAGYPWVTFTLADAQSHEFEPASFDCALSRFGVMFFDDTVAAFANIASALRPGGRIAFATWGEIASNPYFTLPAGIAKTHIGKVERSDPDLPGPFALRDLHKTCAMLRDAGLREVTGKALALDLTPQGDALAVARLMCAIGPAQKALEVHAADDASRARLAAAIAQALAPFETPQGIRLPAEINIFTARKAA